MKEWIGEARTAEDAVARGLRSLGVTREDVSIQILGERSSALLSLFGFRRVKVRVLEKSSRRTASPHGMDTRRKGGRHEKENDFAPSRREDEAPRSGKKNDRTAGRSERRDLRRTEEYSEERRPGHHRPSAGSAQKTERSNERPADAPRRPPKQEPRPERRGPRPSERKIEKPAVEKTAFHPPIPPESLLGQWKDLLGWDDLRWEIQPAQARRLPVILKTSWGEKLAGSGGRPLEAFEYLFNLISSGGDRERPWVSFRIEGFASADEQRLVDQALFAAFQVRRTGTPFRLDPMPSALRRKVHQALANHPDVETTSEGEGATRRVVVKPRVAGSAPTPPA